MVGIGLKPFGWRMDPRSSSGEGGCRHLGRMMSRGKFGLGQNKIVAFVVFVNRGGWFLLLFVHGFGLLLAGSVLLS